MSFYIRKSSGEKQLFDLDKFRRSLLRAGAQEHEIDAAVQFVIRAHPSSTKQIHQLVTNFLQKSSPAVANRYNLKRALMELGPEGYPFEQFVAQLFTHQGYAVETNALVAGACVDHEVDISAKKDTEHFMIECKFHNRAGLKSDVKVALYVYARFEDIHDAWQKNQEHTREFHKPWLVTNTQFTTQAIKYALCKRMNLIGWAYPEQGNIAQLIERYKLFPVTTLTSLTRRQKNSLLRNGFVLCKDAQQNLETLRNLGLSSREISKIMSESHDVCQL